MPTIPGTLRMTAARVPDAPALAFEGVTYTYRELDTAVDRMAGVLADAGLRHGDRFALMSPDSDGFVLAFYAAMRLGAVVVPVNPAPARRRSATCSPTPAPGCSPSPRRSRRRSTRHSPRTGRPVSPGCSPSATRRAIPTCSSVPPRPTPSRGAATSPRTTTR